MLDNGETNLRTHSDVGNPTYAITQQVFDGSNVKYIVSNSNTLDSVPSVTITSTPSPQQLTCSGNTTANYYQLNPCCSGTTLYGFSASSSKSGTYVYNSQSYVISPTTNTGTINIDTLQAGSCQTYYYSLNDCSNTSSIQHYGFSNCSNLNGTELSYNGTCYYVATTSNSSGSIDLDNLSSCTCGGSVTPPATEYYVLRNCDTATLVVTSTTTNDIALTVNTNPVLASVVQDANGQCYTANATTTDLSQYTTNVGAITSLNTLGCSATPCTVQEYYKLQQCATNNQNYISGQTIQEISLSTNDMVYNAATPSQLYKVIGTTTSGTSIGTVTLSSASDCPAYYELRQCYTLQGGYRAEQDTNQISLSVNDRVAGPCGQPYTVVTVGVTGGGYANIGIVTDLGASGCPSATGPYYDLQRCFDSSTGYTSLQQASDVTFNLNDVVSSGGTNYQIVGTTSSASNQVGVVCFTGTTNCVDPVTPPVVPPASVYYATFISCDDPAGLEIQVYSYQQISTWWVISEVGSFECYRWLNNNQGTNPIELNSNNFNFFTESTSAGVNCNECIAQGSPPPPTPPVQTCFALQLYKSTTSAIDLCNQTLTFTVYTNAQTLASSSRIYTGLGCTSSEPTPAYYSDLPSNAYYYWNGTTLAGPYTQNCP